MLDKAYSYARHYINECNDLRECRNGFGFNLNMIIALEADWKVVKGRYFGYTLNTPNNNIADKSFFPHVLFDSIPEFVSDMHAAEKLPKDGYVTWQLTQLKHYDGWTARLINQHNNIVLSESTMYSAPLAMCSAWLQYHFIFDTSTQEMQQIINEAYKEEPA